MISRNIKTIPILVFVLAIVLLVVGLFACDQLSELISPDTATGSTVKIGLIQPRDHFTSFADGARVGLSQVNARSGLLGREVALIERDNQPAGLRVFPDPQTTINIARELIEQESVVALLGPMY